MKIKENKNGITEITTEVFQACNGAIFLNWKNTKIKLEKDDASIIANDIKNFSIENFNNYYSNKIIEEKDNIDEIFTNLIREKMNDSTFKKWKNSWFDNFNNIDDDEEICKIAENWNIEDKMNTLIEYNYLINS